MKNWLPLVFAPEFAIESAPRKLRSTGENSSSNGPPQMLSPPVPSPFGSPPWSMKSLITRWKVRPS